MTKCSNCETEDTPMWRRCLDTKLGSFITLCNACGLYYKAKGDHRPRLLITKKVQMTKYEQLMSCLANEADDAEQKVVQFNDGELSDVRIISCFNCKCINTSLWRKDPQGNSMCNACGLYYKKNGVHRPVKEDGKDVYIEIDSNLIRYNRIKRRKRSVSRSETTSSNKSIKMEKSTSPELSVTLTQSPSSSSSSETQTTTTMTTTRTLPSLERLSPTSPTSLPQPQSSSFNNYTFMTTSSTLLVPNSYEIQPLPTPISPPSTSTTSTTSTTSHGMDDLKSPCLPPISALLNAIDSRALDV